MLISHKKGQAWSMDVIVSIIIFTLGIAILSFYTINISSQSQINMDDLNYQGNFASEFILSEDRGIIVGNKVNQTKLDEFYNSDYEEKRIELGIKDDFYFILPDLEISGIPREYVGMKNITPVNNLIQINRFTIYKNKPVTLRFYVWR